MSGQPCATPHIAKSWAEIDFHAAESYVKKLQMRIAKAVQEGRYGKVKSLQWLLYADRRNERRRDDPD